MFKKSVTKNKTNLKSKYNIIYSLLVIIFVNIMTTFNVFSQEKITTPEDSAKARKVFLEQAKVESQIKDIKLTLRNVDISNYPIIKVIVEAFNTAGEPLDTLYADKLFVLENGLERKVISVERLTAKERVPIDFCFAVDITGSMQPYIDAIKSKIYTLSTYLKNNGIDYTFSLILFSDGIDRVYQPTADVSEFLNWLNMVRAFGGADIKENALEALATATKQIKYRPSANKVVILLTDAPFHQAGEGGAGTTKYTTESMIKYLNDNEMRVFGIVPQKLRDYEIIAGRTRGYVYDMDYPISVIMNNFSSQLTNLYALRYRTDKPAIPDSIDISVINELRQELTRKTIPIVELGRKLIIENMLYPTGKSELPVVVQELEVLNEFMNNRPNVVVMIEGHTDGIGSDITNDRLSLQRAESVKKYLTLKGINPNRIKTKGYGKRRPIASNLTEFGRKLNRRTEIVIIAK